MNRRRFLSTSAALSLAASRLTSAAEPPRARLRTGLNAYSFRKELQSKSLTYEDLIRRSLDWNVDGLDLTVYWFPSTAPDFLHGLRNLAYRTGIELYSISVRSELTRAEAAQRRAEVASLVNWIDVANSLGASHIRVFGGKVPDGVDEEKASGWVEECLLRASDYAARRGVILGLENHGGICTRAERILKIVDRVNSPWVAVNLDTGNFVSDVWKQIDLLLPKSVNIQVKVEMVGDDGKHIAQDWDRVAKTVAGSGYKGYLALEYESDGAMEAVPGLLGKLGAVNRKYSS